MSAVRDDRPNTAEAVVIGASAGGVEALLALLGALPRGFTPPVLVVLHLPPHRPSRMVELMSRRCVLPVSEALDKQPVQQGSVVFAPPNYHLLVEPDRHLSLSVDPPVLYSRPAIDPLFESAAAVYGAGLLGVLLTGASQDGSDGVAAIRRCRGRMWIQAPSDAKAPAMPSAALERAGADAVLTLDQLCRRFAAPVP